MGTKKVDWNAVMDAGLDPTVADNDAVHKFLFDVQREHMRACQKFPGIKAMGHAATEEAGEAIKALIDLEQGKATAGDVYAECVQAAAMFCRLATRGDSEREYNPDGAREQSYFAGPVFVPGEHVSQDDPGDSA